MKPISIEEYIASNNPDEIMGLLRSLGSVKPTSHDHMVRLLHKAVVMYPERTFAELAKIETPYCQLLLSSMPEAESHKETTSGCDGGCSGCDGKKKSNADGDTPTAVEKVASDNKIVINVPSFIDQNPKIATAVGTLLFIGAVCLVVKNLK